MKKLLYSLLAVLATLVSCDKITDTPTPEPPKPVVDGNIKQVTLIYAVNRNNLWSDLDNNMKQMIVALKSLPEREYSILVFKTFIDENNVEKAGLFKAVSGTNPVFELQKEYTREVLSTDPNRMKEVFADALQEKGDIYNLFFWGHGSAWSPNFSGHTRSSIGVSGVIDIPEIESFGGDVNNKDYADIDEIKEALPDRKFSVIWFDCCYMSNIETAYELRDKCDVMVAYPTEIYSDGLPYHNILPLILKEPQDIAGAAEALYNYYNLSSRAVTVSVLDMSKIEKVAETSRAILQGGESQPSPYGLQNYSRSSSYPLYDFGQFMREYAQANDIESMLPAFQEALNQFVVNTLAYSKDFNGRPILKENYSGISTHLINNSNPKHENYYKSLDWYKATYGYGKIE